MDIAFMLEHMTTLTIVVNDYNSPLPLGWAIARRSITNDKPSLPGDQPRNPPGSGALVI